MANPHNSIRDINIDNFDTNTTSYLYEYFQNSFYLIIKENRNYAVIILPLQYTNSMGKYN